MTSKEIKIVLAELEQFIEKLLKKIALDIVANLSSAPSEGGTPIDTGWASANWIPYIGSASKQTAGQRPTQGSASKSLQQKQVALVAATYNLDDGDIIIANNVPYIVKLNEGSSRMAGSGFVQRAILKAVKGVR